MVKNSIFVVADTYGKSGGWPPVKSGLHDIKTDRNKHTKETEVTELS